VHASILNGLFWTKMMASLQETCRHACLSPIVLSISTPDSDAAQGQLTGRHHLAFQARDRAMVDAFHAAALAAGGEDNGAPGERPYHPGYYG
jgi:catechol 2,3-dioxygenase-like lactoylglutathione lyase family enzyme